MRLKESTIHELSRLTLPVKISLCKSMSIPFSQFESIVSENKPILSQVKNVRYISEVLNADFKDLYEGDNGQDLTDMPTTL